MKREIMRATFLVDDDVALRWTGRWGSPALSRALSRIRAPKVAPFAVKGSSQRRRHRRGSTK
jgi:hypothetical protein